MPLAASSRYVQPWILRENSFARVPAKGRWVWESTNPGKPMSPPASRRDRAVHGLDRPAEFLLRPDEDDLAAEAGDPGVFDQADVLERLPALRDRPAAGCQLPATGHDAVGFDHEGYFRSWWLLFRMKAGVSKPS